MSSDNDPRPLLQSPRHSRGPRPIGKFTILAGAAIAIALLAFYGPWLSHLVHDTPYKVAGSSMAPTLDAGDHVFADQHYYRSHAIEDGDIVVFRHGSKILVKRVSAVAGESIAAKAGVLYRNGVALNEPYATRGSEGLESLDNFGSREVPAGQIFVTGDDRDKSLDSREEGFGPVLVSDVIGRVKSVYWSSQPGQTGRTFF